MTNGHRIVVIQSAAQQPTLEHLGGIAYRALGVAFHQHHVIPGAAGQRCDQARHPATEHEQLHGFTPKVQARFSLYAGRSITIIPIATRSSR
jgi:hypothetical protein